MVDNAGPVWLGWAAHIWFWIDPTEEFIGLLMTQIASEPGPRLTEIFRNLSQAIIA